MLSEDANPAGPEHAEDAAPYPLRMIEASVSAFSGKVAVRDGRVTLSYERLWQEAGDLSAVLQAKGVEGAHVGVYLRRTASLVVAMLAIWRAGGVYVPVDPAFPRNRLQFMAQDAGLAAVIAGPEDLDVAGSFAPQVFSVENSTPVDSPTAGRHTREAYLLYTSGSSGRPKGVIVSHAALGAFLSSLSARIALTPDDRVAALTTPSFDISFLELIWPLTVGAEVVIADPETAIEGRRLGAFLDQHGITLMQGTPATWRLLMQVGWSGRPEMRALCGGEALPPPLASDLQGRVAELWNMYGPTETTIWASCGLIDRSDDIHVGPPLEGWEISVMDSSGQVAAPGEEGEVIIAGEGLADGYWQRPTETSTAFVTWSDGKSPQRRVYRTGDRGAFDEHGRLVIFGRRDDQVKVRGYRIELAEIELALERHAEIIEAAVQLQTNGVDEPMLVAYPVFPSAPVSTSELRAFLQRDLPDYMIPQAFVPLEALPLTANGKRDRAALPLFIGGPTHDEASPIQTDPLAVLIQTCREVLPVQTITADDNFFDLGGQSLQAAQMLALFEARAGLTFPLRAALSGTLGSLVAIARPVAGMDAEPVA